MAGFAAFGKIPALGDFLRLSAPARVTEPWDAWLQVELPAARDAMGGAWHDAYFSAPIWRFALAPGLAGPAPVLGVLMPSVDRVGRQFPLTLFAEVPGAAPAPLHLGAGALFARLEDIALAALDDDMTVDRLGATLAALPAPEIPAVTARDVPGGTALCAPLSAGDALAAHLAPPRASLWSAVLGQDTRLLVTDTLPAAARFRALFDMAATPWHAAPAEAAP